MKTYTVADIRSWNPCYDPVRKELCDENWTGTVLDVFKAEGVKPDDRIRCAYHMGIPSEIWHMWGALVRVTDD